jgi:hypothetical protein
LFSSGVKREFGENKVISKHDGSEIFSVVEPLRCIPADRGLIVIGSIDIEECQSNCRDAI